MIPYPESMYINIHTHFPASSHDTIAILQANAKEAYSCSGFCSSGIHPWDTTRLSEHELRQALCALTEIIQSPSTTNKLFAIGECGLDKLRGAAMSEQIVWFSEQIRLSESFSKPLIIHCVKAWDELFALHKQLKPHMPWIIHGFRGKPQLAKQLLSKMNISLSFGVNFNSESLRITPLSKLFIETDDILYDLSALYYSIANERNIPVRELISQIECNFVSLNL